MMHGKFYDIHEISPATQTGFFSLRRLQRGVSSSRMREFFIFSASDNFPIYQPIW